MNNKLISTSKIIIPILFWISVWEIVSLIVNNSYFFPTVTDTFSSLLTVISSKTFFKVVLLTFLRVVTGLLLGIVIGTLLAFLAHRFAVIETILSPIITIIKSTPVATFIIIFWVIMDGDMLSVFIAFLMVMPIIWQNLMDAFDSIDKNLSEVCDVFEFSFAKRMRFLIFPALLKYFIPGVITATGLTWKSEIAAEIIAYTKNSIGQYINDAKYNFDTATVFAWTLIIITMSTILEKITKYLLRRIKV